MGLLEIFKSSEEKEHKLGVCIPNHAKPKLKTKPLQEKEKSKPAKKKRVNKKVKITSGTVVFETRDETEKREKKKRETVGELTVNSIYGVADTTMIEGNVISGTISIENVLETEEGIISVREIKRDGKSAIQLFEGEKGVIFLSKPFFKIKGGEILEFKA